MTNRLFLSLIPLVILLIFRTAPCLSQDDGLLFWDDFQKYHQAELQRDPFLERIETERHDFTQSTKTVGRGVVQVEAGYSFFYKDHEDEIEESHTLPETLIRWGISEDIELRLRTNYVWRFKEPGETELGSEDLRLSTKLGITEAKSCIPESALEIRLTVPTGSDDWTTEEMQFGLDYIFGWPVSETAELYGSAGYATDGLADFSLLPDEQASEDFNVWTASTAIGVELTESSTIYIEWFGLFSSALADNFTISIFNIGVDYYLSENFVIDVRAGVGLTDDADDFFCGVGGGYRF